MNQILFYVKCMQVTGNYSLILSIFAVLHQLADFCVYFFLGVLTVWSSLDREAVFSYTLVASAVDNGGKSCTTEIQLSVSDVNDNPPILVPVSGAVMISEGASINTLVYRVAASDYDIGRYLAPKLVFFFMLNSTEHEIFNCPEKLKC